MSWLLSSVSDEKLIELCAKCTSYSQVVKLLGKSNGRGCGYGSVKKRIQSLNIDVSHFTGKTWNKGLSKADHSSIAKYSETLHVKTKGRVGIPHSVETKKKLSQSRIRYLETHNDHGLAWYEVKCGNKTVKVQGTWEKLVAEWLNEQGISWKRKSLNFLGHRKYTPDFYLTEYDIFLEVKGYWRDRDIYKTFLVLDEHDIDLRIVDRNNIQNLSLNFPRFCDHFVRENIDIQKFHNVWG